MNVWTSWRKLSWTKTEIKFLCIAWNIQISMSKVPVMLQWEISRSIYPWKENFQLRGWCSINRTVFFQTNRKTLPQFPLKRAKFITVLFYLCFPLTPLAKAHWTSEPLCIWLNSRETDVINVRLHWASWTDMFWQYRNANLWVYKLHFHFVHFSVILLSSCT